MAKIRESVENENIENKSNDGGSQEISSEIQEQDGKQLEDNGSLEGCENSLKDPSENKNEEKTPKSFGEKIYDAARTVMLAGAAIGGFIGGFDPSGIAPTLQEDRNVIDAGNVQRLQFDERKKEGDVASKYSNIPKESGDGGFKPNDVELEDGTYTVYLIKDDELLEDE